MGGNPALKRRGPKPRALVEFPQPVFDSLVDPPEFADAFKLQLERHGDTFWHLAKAIHRPGDRFDRTTLRQWAQGIRRPGTIRSLQILERIEDRYRLPNGYFRDKLTTSGRAPAQPGEDGLSAAERRRLAWHLPDDFSRRPAKERAEILGWIRRVIITGATKYRCYQAQRMKERYALSFPRDLVPGSPSDDQGSTAKARRAPVALTEEVRALLDFKCATLTMIGAQRRGVWGAETAAQKVDHLGLMFGAMAAAPRSSVRGHGVPLGQLTVALLVLPCVWDWYLQWREARRGFFTTWEVNMLALGAALTRRETGWLRQNSLLAERLQPIAGWMDAIEVRAVQADWDGACDAAHRHVLARAHEIRRVARIHRDPFEPILPVLEADSPLSEYRRITTEILSRMPDPRHHPLATAEAVRGFLMLRLGLHLGVRQKNLRQLLFTPRGATARSERELADLRRGELRWSDREMGWEVLIPAVAFKNAESTFFGRRPFRLLLPDLDRLYEFIDAYLGWHRRRLLGGAGDPDTFFVKTAKRTSRSAAYNQDTFYEAWRLVIQRYGVFNPYTGKGAIRGLLPHGPHNVRDVLATHILKQTGSYEQASYAIQDTPETVAQHYGRFLPQDKVALAAQVLNKVWQASG